MGFIVFEEPTILCQRRTFESCVGKSVIIDHHIAKELVFESYPVERFLYFLVLFLYFVQIIGSSVLLFISKGGITVFKRKTFLLRTNAILPINGERLIVRQQMTFKTGGANRQINHISIRYERIFKADAAAITPYKSHGHCRIGDILRCEVSFICTEVLFLKCPCIIEVGSALSKKFNGLLFLILEIFKFCRHH